MLLCPDGRVRIADIKSGAKADQYGGATSAQIATYAHGSLYDPTTGQRYPLGDIDLDTGLMIHLPQGTGHCTIYDVDLRSGWLAAQMAKAIRDWRKTNPLTRWTP
jgi:hypothetical protein